MVHQPREYCRLVGRDLGGGNRSAATANHHQRSDAEDGDKIERGDEIKRADRAKLIMAIVTSHMSFSSGVVGSGER